MPDRFLRRFELFLLAAGEKKIEERPFTRKQPSRPGATFVLVGSDRFF